MVPLASLIEISESVQPSKVDQFQQLNSAMIEVLWKMMPGVSIGEAYKSNGRGSREDFCLHVVQQ